ncbi:UNVERIFIED_CONTAM: hypothetical protein FKN15_050537 [Acipenser sinensis]
MEPEDKTPDNRYAWSHGDPRKVIYPTDSRGQFCGQAGTELEKTPFLFYFNIMKCASPLVLLEFQCPTTQICVEKCPDKFMTLLKAYANPSDMDYYKKFCKPEFAGMTKLSAPEVLRDGYCPAMLIPSRPFTRRCFPALRAKKGVITVDNHTTFDDGMGERRNVTDLLEGAKPVTCGSRFSSGTSTSSMMIMPVAEARRENLPWICGVESPGMPRSSRNPRTSPSSHFAHTTHTSAIGELVILRHGRGGGTVTKIHKDGSMIILCIIEVVIILLLIFLRKRIVIAIALIKEASRAVGHVMCSLIYPLLTFALLALVIAYWAITAVYPFLPAHPGAGRQRSHFSVGLSLHARTAKPVHKILRTFNTTNITKACPDAKCIFAFYGGETYYHKYLIFFQFYNVFLFFWCANFVTALGQVTLAGAFASFYWAFKKPDDMPAFPIFTSLGRALRYHTGSLAFGSLILSIVQVIRVLLEYLDHKLKGHQNKFTKFLLCCLKCCFWCLEKFIKFLNRNAYIMIAIYGKNFCTSARNAFFLLMRNIVRVAVLNKVTEFLLFLGKLLIVGSVGILSFFFFSGRIKPIEDTTPTLNYYWVPILTVVIGSYFIAHGFFSVYGMCVDTLFLCFLEDLERNDGSQERPYFMPDTLLKALKKKNEAKPSE